jgi:hypothetical protein
MGVPTLAKRTAEAAFCRLTRGQQASCFLTPLALVAKRDGPAVRRRSFNICELW